MKTFGIAALCAAGAMAWAGMAQAAIYVIDFEGYTVGDVAGSGPVPYYQFGHPSGAYNPLGSGLLGTPFPIVFAIGNVGVDSDPAIGQYLELNGAGLSLYSQFRATQWRVGNDVYSARVLSYDIRSIGVTTTGFAGTPVPTEWTTVAGSTNPREYNLPRYYGDGVQVDNIVVSIGDPFTVPEPATWGLMILGFGLAGASLRRRRYAASSGLSAAAWQPSVMTVRSGLDCQRRDLRQPRLHGGFPVG